MDCTSWLGNVSIGYYLDGTGHTTDIVYNFADLVNKAAFGLVIWAAAKSDKS